MKAIVEKRKTVSPDKYRTEKKTKEPSTKKASNKKGGHVDIASMRKMYQQGVFDMDCYLKTAGWQTSRNYHESKDKKSSTHQKEKFGTFNQDLKFNSILMADSMKAANNNNNNNNN